MLSSLPDMGPGRKQKQFRQGRWKRLSARSFLPPTVRVIMLPRTGFYKSGSCKKRSIVLEFLTPLFPTVEKNHERFSLIEGKKKRG